MVNIYNDKDKLSIICDFVRHQHAPYGTQKLVYPINSLSIDTDTDLIKFNNKIGGELFYTFLSELKFNGVQATRANIDKLFNDVCTNCCGGGGSITGDVTVDLTEVVNLLKEIRDKISGGGGTCDTSDILCAIGDVSCALDTINGEEIGGYYSTEDCNLLTEINGEEINE